MPVRARDRDRQRVRARERRPTFGMTEPGRRGRGQCGDEPALGELPHPVAEHPGREAVLGDDDARMGRRVGELRLDRWRRASGSRARRGPPSARSPVPRAPARAARPAQVRQGQSQSTRVRPCPTRPRASASRKWSARISTSPSANPSRPSFSRTSRSSRQARHQLRTPVTRDPAAGARERVYEDALTNLHSGARESSPRSRLTAPCEPRKGIFGMRHPKHLVLLTAVGLFVLVGAPRRHSPHPADCGRLRRVFRNTDANAHADLHSGREHVPRHQRRPGVARRRAPRRAWPAISSSRRTPC